MPSSRPTSALRLVVENSHSAKPMLYKISGTWGNHEGSMLLWVLILALFGAMAAWFGGQLAADPAGACAGGAIFHRRGILRLHPLHLEPVPALDRAALRRAGPQPAAAGSRPRLPSAVSLSRLCRPFDLLLFRRRRPDRRAAWMPPGGAGYVPGRWRPGLFLTIGIALGSWWAYYELGWGGFWFWDPVENASFMPWLLAAALLHSAIVVEKREALESLDDPACDPRLRLLADRHVHRALGSADIRACLRERPRARACSS